VVWNPSDEGQGRGLRVVSVAAGSSASRAGLRAGDRILRFNGHDVTLGADLRGLVLAAENSVSLTVARDGSAQPINLSFELAGPPVRLGLSWRTDDAEPRAVIVSRVVPSSPVAKAGIQVNDRIYEVSGQPFANDAEFRRLLAEANGKDLDFLTEREGRVRSVPIKRPISATE
jgi:serine protease Do